MSERRTLHNLRQDRNRISHELRECRNGWRKLKEVMFGEGTDADKMADVRRILGNNLQHATSTPSRWYDLVRYDDPTGVSGTGRVAEIAEFEDGTTVLRWLSGTPSTVIYDSLDHVVRIHGHGGSTEVVPR